VQFGLQRYATTLEDDDEDDYAYDREAPYSKIRLDQLSKAD